uniref:Uncharacterized protein n=1 Tax=Arundo donax TaxID=35708 RepID=A0A0A9GZV6_ARUDO
MTMLTFCGSKNGIFCKLCMFQRDKDQREDRISRMYSLASGSVGVWYHELAANSKIFVFSSFLYHKILLTSILTHDMLN